MADVYDAHRLVVKRLKLVMEILSRHHGANCITLLVAMSMGKIKKFLDANPKPGNAPKTMWRKLLFPHDLDDTRLPFLQPLLRLFLQLVADGRVRLEVGSVIAANLPFRELA